MAIPTDELFQCLSSFSSSISSPTMFCRKFSRHVAPRLGSAKDQSEEKRTIGAPDDSIVDITPIRRGSFTAQSDAFFRFNILSLDFAFVRTLVRFGPSRVLGSPLFLDHSWTSDLMGRAAITGTLPSPRAKIVDAHSRKLSEGDPDRSSSDLIFRKTPGASDRSFLRR